MGGRVMWVVAGVLLGFVIATLLAGFHFPHAHFAASAIGGLLALWLVLIAVDGGSSASVVWPLFGLDVAVSAGAGALAWQGRRTRTAPGLVRPLDGAEGVAVTDLSPDGVVRVRGEQWSAVSVNGGVRAGTAVQVLRADGVRLDVWGEDPDVLPPGWSPESGRSAGGGEPAEDGQPASRSQARQIGEQEP